MEPTLLGGLAIGTLFLLFTLRVPIAFGLGATASAGVFLFFAWPPGGPFTPGAAWRPLLSLLASEPYAFITSYPLTAVPLFILTGHLAHLAGFTADIYHAARVWLGRVPGGLSMASIIGCGGFSAITGSSVACAAAMGRIAIPEMLRHGYGKGLAAGSVAMGGTLGSLIPPSILFILYGVFTEESVGRLFLAGILPGAVSLAGFLLVVYVWARMRPADAPAPKDTFGLAERLRAAARSWPLAALFVLVVGGLYFGIFTPTESAAAGCALTAAVGLATGRLNRSLIVQGLSETVLQTATIFAIALSAKIFISFTALTGIPEAILVWSREAELTTAAFMAVVVLLYLALGMFLDSIGILLLTLPIVTPVVESFDLNLIWFGVVVVKLLEIGLVTPPIGLNAFVIKSAVGDAIRLETIFLGILWFLVADFAVLALLVFFPSISLFIPNLMR